MRCGTWPRTRVTRRFTDELDLRRARALRGPTTVLGQVGYLTLGRTYSVVGVLVALAGDRHDPEQATGLDTALS